MISLFLPSCGGVSMECSKKGCQSSKTLLYKRVYMRIKSYKNYMRSISS